MRAQLLAGVVVAVVAAAGVRAADEPKPKFTQDGNDLVVSVEVTANNSAHALLAWTEGDDKALTLKYVLVQNTSIFVRSQKRVTVEWRLPGKKEADVTVKGVEPVSVHLKTGELKPFAEQMKKLVEAGEKKGG